MKNTVFFPLEIILGEEGTKIADTKTQSPCKENMPRFSKTGKYVLMLREFCPVEITHVLQF